MTTVLARLLRFPTGATQPAAVAVAPAPPRDRLRTEQQRLKEMKAEHEAARDAVARVEAIIEDAETKHDALKAIEREAEASVSAWALAGAAGTDEPGDHSTFARLAVARAAAAEAETRKRGAEAALPALQARVSETRDAHKEQQRIVGAATARIIYEEDCRPLVERVEALQSELAVLRGQLLPFANF